MNNHNRRTKKLTEYFFFEEFYLFTILYNHGTFTLYKMDTSNNKNWLQNQET